MTPKSCLVKDYMTRTLITFTPEMDVLDAVHLLVQHRIAGAPVVDDHGSLTGMLSELDCMRVALGCQLSWQLGWAGRGLHERQPANGGCRDEHCRPGTGIC